MRDRIVPAGDQSGLPEGQVILFEQFRMFKRTWKLVLAIAIVATAGVAVYVFGYMPVEYMAVVRALPPNKSGTPLDNIIGGISTSLKDFGLSKLVGKAGSDNGYSRSVLITSQPLFDSLISHYDLFTVYGIPKGRYDKVYKKMAENINVDISPEGPISVEVYDENPERAAKMANDVIFFTNMLSRELNRRESEPLTKYIGARYEQTRDDQEKLGAELRQFMAKSKLYDPESQAKIIGTAVTEAEGDVAAKRTLVEVYRKALGEDDPRTIQAKTLLEQAEAQSRRLAAGHAGVLNGPSVENLPASTVEYLRLRQDYEVNAKVLALLEPMYEQAKYDELRDIPVLNVLDPARVPPEKARPKRSIILASAFIGTIIVAYLIIAIVAYIRSFLQRYRAYNDRAALPEGPHHAGELNP
ncbi:MAG: hypothetical protein JST22_16250 [Bacteroidetes bacterium]|nr:hypothetical protein [Bacteroidota bacterium]